MVDTANRAIRMAGPWFTIDYICLLRASGKIVTEADDESGDEEEDCLEGTVDSSASSSDFDEDIPFPTKPQVIVKKNHSDEQHTS